MTSKKHLNYITNFVSSSLYLKKSTSLVKFITNYHTIITHIFYIWING